MPTSLADKHYSFDIPSHLLFQSPLSRGTPPDLTFASKVHYVSDKFQSPLSRGTTPDKHLTISIDRKACVSIPSKSGHHSRQEETGR